MVCDDTDRHVGIIFFSILGIRKTAHMLSELFDRINVEHGVYILHDTGKTLQPHAGINVLLLQLGIIVVSVVIELRKYVVPDLHIPVAVTAHRTIRLSAAIGLASVIINF